MVGKTQKPEPKYLLLAAVAAYHKVSKLICHYFALLTMHYSRNLSRSSLDPLLIFPLHAYYWSAKKLEILCNYRKRPYNQVQGFADLPASLIVLRLPGTLVEE
jgi:hypothetical protein